ncbi:hypothetical protein K469DRAFT_742554 [Zopfia rhizophila CBS 207.26]|uniref:Rhodopsin domain-containing protein n=1 Tax=Zopfia rhizophila CBS 207.26 TaxID=1314779 RepID=A0A6A6DFW5_9PEZI|nr:hypothetical protein K469DRAFT_742554 [Zopfia rhizophila CBS 207.26]
MLPSPDRALDHATTAVCASLILFRCSYRLLLRCNIHSSCHRTWHADDAYMAFAIVPLIARTVCISLSFVLNPSQTFGLATETDAAASGMSVAELQENYITSHKLLIPGRISYLLFLWCLKLCLMNFYSRFVDVFRWGKKAAAALWWTIVITFFVILIPTLAECRPMNLYWDPDPQGLHTCHRALGNLVTMAVFNIITDIALIVFPFPILRYSTLTGRQKIQLGILFSIGFVIVAITILRLPMIFSQSVSQQARSTWASIEIMCACIVANTAFYFTLLRDVQRGHDLRPSTTDRTQDDLYLQRVQSTTTHSHSRDLENGGPLVVQVSQQFIAYESRKK